MPVPKRKTSKSRRDKRRTHWKLASRGMALCPRCQEAKFPHRVCPNCGYYKDHQVLEAKE
jgi:large subunit ribosomal protein L32